MSQLVELSSLGRYEIDGELGRGSMGVVYRGYDPVLDRAVALKTILFQASITEEEKDAFLERFFLETRIAAKLVHPNIVVTYDAAVDEATSIPFMAMELVEGEGLNVRLAREKKLPWHDALGIAVPIARALAYAHRAGVVHRDLKPANVLLTEDGEPKLADFGIAKLSTAEVTQAGLLLGTPKYMSPEQFRSEKVDGRSDQFSLAVLLYRMLVGRVPFDATEIGRIAYQTLEIDPPAPSSIDTDLPKEIDTILARALAKATEDRYPSAADFAQSLQALRDEKISPPSLSTSSADASAVEETEARGTPTISHHPSLWRWLAFATVVVALLVTVQASLGGSDLNAQRHFYLESLERSSTWIGDQLRGLAAALGSQRTDGRERAGIRSQARSLIDRGRPLEERSAWDEALDAYRESRELYRQARDGVGEATALLAMGRVEAVLARATNARADLDTAAALYRIYREPAGQRRALLELANLERDRGRDAEAEELYRQALVLSQDLGDGAGSAEVQLETAVANLLEGDLGPAREGLDAVLRVADAALRKRATLWLAVLHFASGDRQLERAAWSEARGSAAESQGDLADSVAELDLFEGRAALYYRELATARQYLEAASIQFRASRRRPSLLSALESLSLLASLEGREAESSLHQQQANELERELGFEPETEIEQARDRLQLLEVELGDSQRQLARLRFLLDAAPSTPAHRLRQAMLWRRSRAGLREPQRDEPEVAP